MGWTIDRRISIPNLLQLMAIIVFCVSFYDQTKANQLRNDERFTEMAKQADVRDKQMQDMQKAQDQIVISLTQITERMSSTTDALKEVRDAIKAKDKK